MENQPLPEQPQQPSLPQQPLSPQQPPQGRKSLGLKIALIAIVPILIMAIAAYFIISNSSQPATDTVAQIEVNSTATMQLEPAEATVAAGDDVSLSIWIDTGSSSVNAVQAELSYDSDVFEFIQADTSESVFEIEAETSERDGIIRVARGQIGTVSGRLFVARVHLRALAATSSADISFTQGSVVVGSGAENILDNTTGANIVVEPN